MRYSTSFYSTNDETIKRRPGIVNIGLKRDCLKIELYRKKIPYDRIQNVTTDREVTKKDLSAKKALAGAVLAGPAGAVVGAVMGGKKVLSTIKFEYLNDDDELREVVFKTKSAEAIKAKYMKKSGVTS